MAEYNAIKKIDTMLKSLTSLNELAREAIEGGKVDPNDPFHQKIAIYFADLQRKVKEITGEIEEEENIDSPENFPKSFVGKVVNWITDAVTELKNFFYSDDQSKDKGLELCNKIDALSGDIKTVIRMVEINAYESPQRSPQGEKNNNAQSSRKEIVFRVLGGMGLGAAIKILKRRSPESDKLDLSSLGTKTKPPEPPFETGQVADKENHSKRKSTKSRIPVWTGGKGVPKSWVKEIRTKNKKPLQAKS